MAQESIFIMLPFLFFSLGTTLLSSVVAEEE